MRRPSPLPPPPAGAASARSARALDPDGGPPADADETADAAVAPVIPLTATATLPRPDGPEPLPGMAATGEEPDAEGIDLGDVWRAARARRKALRAEVRRFTGRQRRRRLAWIAAGSAVLALILATLGAAYSPLFAVERVRVVGVEMLDAALVEEALASQLGTPLPLVDESAVKAALVEFPLVETYALEARPPHELVVRIVERTPVGLLPTAAGYTLVDAAGVALSTTEKPSDGYPVIDIPGGTRTPAFETLGLVMRSLPAEIRDRVTEVSATTRDDVAFVIDDDAEVVWGSAAESALKALVLEKAMAANPDREFFDVSSPSAVVVR